MCTHIYTSVYIYIYMYIYIYIYIPVALRAISATVPTSFFVLACQRLHVSVDISMIIFSHGVPRWHEVTEDCVTLASVLVTTKRGRQKLIENDEKLTPGRVPEALGGGLGTILVPRVARRRKRPENGLGDPPPGTQLGSKF